MLKKIKHPVCLLFLILILLQFAVLFICAAQKDAYSEAYPDCIVVKRGVQPYGYGWRYIDDGYNFNDYYKTMRQIFHYDEESLLNGYAWDEATKNDPW